MASRIPGGGGEVELNSAGMRELMKSPEMQSLLRKRMGRVQSALPGSELKVSISPTRARATVARGSDYDEANTGELSRALNMSGGQRGTLNVRAKPRPRKS